MNGFHGNSKRRSYFEGWYFKQQNETEAFAVIAAFHIDRAGRRSASIQVICADGAWNYDFPGDSFQAERGRFHVTIGDNVFSEEGITLNLRSPDIRGTLRYGPFTYPETDVMGPYRFVPAMQCRHGVLSNAHRVEGAMQVQGRTLEFHGGLGYCETDRGSSFPRRYLWTQCSWDQENPCSVMISAAHVPLLGGSITGCIGLVYFGGREYRLATYGGVKIVKWDASSIILKQKDYLLEAEVLEKTEGKGLIAPDSGGMTRPVHESLSCRMRYRFSKGDKLLFDLESGLASFEYADKDYKSRTKAQIN